MRLRVEEQQEFRPVLPVVVGNADYRRFRDRLERVEELLRLSGLEDTFVETGLTQWVREGKETAQKRGVPFRQPPSATIAKHQRALRQALRCTGSLAPDSAPTRTPTPSSPCSIRRPTRMPTFGTGPI